VTRRGAACVALLTALLLLGGRGGGAPRCAVAQEVPAGSAGAARAPAQLRDSAELDALTQRVASQLRCPVCQGLSLADSPSELAQEMKDVVRSQLAAGRTPDEVKQYFVAKYGEWILLEPARRGVNLLVYVLPVFAVLVGLGVIWLALGKWTSAAPAGGGLAASADPDTDLAD
jgi:cytochrome c-type biogenesis protein CcmH